MPEPMTMASQCSAGFACLYGVPWAIALSSCLSLRQGNVDTDNISLDLRCCSCQHLVIKKGVTDAKPYHHANLRKTLLDAAVALIGEVGPRAFTLREVARRAGVSHNAPYRHFASKDELLVAVAAEGFERLTAVMEETMAEASSPLERVE